MKTGTLQSRTTDAQRRISVLPKIHSHSQIFRYDQSIFCLSHRPNFSDIFGCQQSVPAMITGKSCFHYKEQVCSVATIGFIPIPTGQGRNQPLYEHHVIKSGRNRVDRWIDHSMTFSWCSASKEGFKSKKNQSPFRVQKIYFHEIILAKILAHHFELQLNYVQNNLFKSGKKEGH